MLLGAVGSKRAEAFLVVRTRGQSRVWVDVEVQTFIYYCQQGGKRCQENGQKMEGILTSIATIAIAYEEIAFWHLPQIELV